MELSKTHFCTKQTSKISSRWARSRFHILSLSRWLNNICTFDYLICFTQHGFFYSFCPILKKFSYEVVMFAIQHQYWDCFSYWCENFRKKCVASFFFYFRFLTILFCFKLASIEIMISLLATHCFQENHNTFWGINLGSLFVVSVMNKCARQVKLRMFEFLSLSWSLDR